MNELTVSNGSSLDVWGADFEAAQRIAKALASAAIFPAKFKDVGSCMIVLDMSQRLGMSAMEIAQSIDIIHGNPGWKSEYVLRKIAENPRYVSTRYNEYIDGKVKLPNGSEIDNRVCSFVATLADGTDLEGSPCSYRTAVAEGWWGRRDSKWPNMPEKMLRFRAASWFNREYPSVETAGISTAEEVADVPVQDIGFEEVQTTPPVNVAPKTKARPAVKQEPPKKPAAQPVPDTEPEEDFGEDMPAW